MGRVRRFRRAMAAALRATIPPLAQDLGLARGFVLAAPSTGQVVYRLVGRSSTAELRTWDFESNRDRPNRPRGPQQDYMDWLGISVFGTLEHALDNAVRYPKLVAPVRLVPGRGFMVARTEADIDEHYSVWGDPQDLLANVVGDVVRVNQGGLD